MIYGWIGRCSDTREARIMGEIMDDNLPIQFNKYSKQVLTEGDEPENFFWVGLGVDIRGKLKNIIQVYTTDVMLPKIMSFSIPRKHFLENKNEIVIDKLRILQWWRSPCNCFIKMANANDFGSEKIRS